MNCCRVNRNIWVLCVTLLLLNGCSLPSKYEIYNNTGTDLRVVQNISGEIETFDIAPNSTVILESWDAYGEAHFIVLAGEVQWNYKPVYISHKYGDLKYFSHVLFRVQIEKDGSVAVLGPGKSFPQTKHVAQPEGYPLRPRDENV